MDGSEIAGLKLQDCLTRELHQINMRLHALETRLYGRQNPAERLPIQREMLAMTAIEWREYVEPLRERAGRVEAYQLSR